MWGVNRWLSTWSCSQSQSQSGSHCGVIHGANHQKALITVLLKCPITRQLLECSPSLGQSPPGSQVWSHPYGQSPGGSALSMVLFLRPIKMLDSWPITRMLSTLSCSCVQSTGSFHPSVLPSSPRGHLGSLIGRTNMDSCPLLGQNLAPCTLWPRLPVSGETLEVGTVT